MMRAPCGRRAFALRHIYGSVAQLVEQYPFKVLVLGSSPSRPKSPPASPAPWLAVFYVNGDTAAHLLTHSQVYAYAAANRTAARVRFSAASRPYRA